MNNQANKESNEKLLKPESKCWGRYRSFEMVSHVSRTRKHSPFPFCSSVCILAVTMWENFMMKNKTTGLQRRETGTNTLIYMLKPMKGGIKLTGSQTSNVMDTCRVMSLLGFCVGIGYAWADPTLYITPWPIAVGSSYWQPAPLLTPRHAEPLAAKRCHGGWHGWMWHQYKQTEQKLISLPEISQQMKCNLEKYSDGNAVMLLRAVPAHSTYLAPSVPLNPVTRDIWCFGWAVARTWWTTSTAPKEGTLSESHFLQKPVTK